MKRLVYYLYVSDDFSYNYFVKCNMLCLKQYINVFDFANFIISVDDVNDGNKIKLGHDFINEVCKGADLKHDTIVVSNNRFLREVVAFDTVIHPLIENECDDSVFFAHSKGLFRFGFGDKKINFSIMMWIPYLYYYNFERLYEMEEAFSKGKLFYGPNLILLNKNVYYDTILNVNGKEVADNVTFNSYCHYSGCFYWINPKNIKKEIEKDGIDFYGTQKYMHFIEFFPMYFKTSTLSSYNDVFVKGGIYNQYYMDYDKWIDYIKLIDKDTKAIPFMKKIILESKKQ